MLKPRRVAMLLVVLTVVFLTPSWAHASETDAPRITMPSGTQCPPITIYAVRGTNEAFDDEYLGAGRQWKPLYDRLRAAYGAESVGLIANGYLAPSLPPYGTLQGWTEYGSRVKRGVADAVADINAFVDRCRNEDGFHTLLVAGYSAGADVIRRAEAQIDPTTLPERLIRGTFLLGDPNFDPMEDYAFGSVSTAVLHGDYDYGTLGLMRKSKHYRSLAGLSSPPSLDRQWTVQSWCHAFDVICQGGLKTATIDDHVNYATRDGFAMTGHVPTFNLAQLVPLAAPRVAPGPYGTRELQIFANYMPPHDGTTVGGPESVRYVSTLDDNKLIDSRDVHSYNLFYGFTLPDKRIHKLTIVVTGQIPDSGSILENKYVYGGCDRIVSSTCA